jgi:isopentenyldiphosphate isomerase
MDTEKVGIFNENGVFIGSASKKEALDKNLRRGVVRVFLLNKKGFLYVQKRGENMEIAPGLWDQSAGGHIDSKENPKESALRELKEELGIKLDNLDFVTSYSFEEEQDGKVLSSFDFIFVGKSDDEIHIQKEELSGGKWFNVSELKSEFSKFPERFASGFRKSFPIFLSTING